MKRISRELGTRVPKVLAAEKRRSIGAPGKVSYRVQRGKLRLRANKHELQIITRLNGDVQVCKPFGPICARYGRCRPEWDVAISLPIKPGKLKLKAKTNIAIRKGCVLSPVGYNATRELEKITRQQSRQVSRRINRELAQAERQLHRALSKSTETLRFSDDSCLEATPTQWLLATPHIDDGQLWLNAFAELSLNAACSAAQGKPGPPRANASKRSPAPELRTNVPEGIELSAAIALPLASIDQELSQKSGQPLEFAARRQNGKNQLFVHSPGNCKHGWEAITATTNKGMLNLRPAAPNPRGWFEAVSIPLPKPVRELQATQRTLERELRQQLEREQKRLKFRTHLDVSHTLTVEVDSTSLWLRPQTQGTLELRVEE